MMAANLLRAIKKVNSFNSVYNARHNCQLHGHKDSESCHHYC